MSDEKRQAEPSFLALVPFIVFVVFYVGLSIWARDFYRVPMIIAFVLADGVAFLQSRKVSLNTKMELYAKGMGELNIMIMCMIFILAGAFASVAKGMGAVDSAVLIARHLIPARFMLVGFFLMASFLSMAIGTSCGTIACLVPIAMGMVEPLGISPEMMLGTVIGGSMFGDNLSMISDTTIAATRTQGVEMKDKFWMNIRFIIPAAVICVVIYFACGSRDVASSELASITGSDLLHVIPYIVIIVLALAGMNVLAVLFLGILLASAIGLFTNGINFWDSLDLAGKGALGMSETLIIALLAGGLLYLIRWNGGIDYIMNIIRNTVKTQRGCEIGVCVLTALVNLFTANNTVAIVIAGPIAKELSDHYGCDGKRIASILDTSSCVVQGVIPYGAQVLSAVALAKAAGFSINSFGVLSQLFYPYLMGICLLVAITLHRSKNKTQANA